MSALRPETRRMIALARQGDRPRAGAQHRVERALAAKALLLGGTAASGAVVTTSAAASSVLFKPLLVVGVALGVVSGGYGGARLLGVGQPATPAVAAPAASGGANAMARAPAAAARSESAEPAPSAERRPVPPVEAQVAVAPRSGSAPRQAEPSVAASVSESTLRAETSALRTAQKALRDGDTARALALLASEAELHPNGALVQERAAARVLALCQAGNVAAARTEARQFESAYPTSPLRARLRAACAEPRVAP